jgi:hypothetical protein
MRQNDEDLIVHSGNEFLRPEHCNFQCDRTVSFHRINEAGISTVDLDYCLNDIVLDM